MNPSEVWVNGHAIGIAVLILFGHVILWQPYNYCTDCGMYLGVKL